MRPNDPLAKILIPTREEAEQWNYKAKKLATDYIAPANALAWGFITDYAEELKRAGLYRFRVKHLVRSAIRDYERFDREVRVKTPKGSALILTSFYDALADSVKKQLQTLRDTIAGEMGIPDAGLLSGASVATILAEYAVQNFDTSYGGPECSPKGQVVPSLYFANVSFSFLRCGAAYNHLRELEETLLPKGHDRKLKKAVEPMKRIMSRLADEKNIWRCYQLATESNVNELLKYEDGKEIIEIYDKTNQTTKPSSK